MSADPVYTPPLLTVEEYLALEHDAETKSEYFQGHVIAMAGGSPEHAALAINIGSELRNQLRGKECRVYSSDLKVAIPIEDLITYPDLSVVCGESRFLDDRRDVLTNPQLLVEILSPSTEAYDRGKKFYSYRQIESLTDYLLVAQDEPAIDYYRKQDEGQWVLTSVRGLEGTLLLPSLGITLRLSEVYDGITFPEPSSFLVKRSG